MAHMFFKGVDKLKILNDTIAFLSEKEKRLCKTKRAKKVRGGLVHFPIFLFEPTENMKMPELNAEMSEKEMLNIALHRKLEIFEAEIFCDKYPEYFM